MTDLRGALAEYYDRFRQGEDDIDPELAVQFLHMLLLHRGVSETIEMMRPPKAWDGPPYPQRAIVILDGQWLRIVGTPPYMRFSVDAERVTSVGRAKEYIVGKKHFEWGGYDRLIHHVRLGSHRRETLPSGRVVHYLTTHPDDLERIARHKAQQEAEKQNIGV